jgi:hypothetical protein
VIGWFSDVAVGLRGAYVGDIVILVQLIDTLCSVLFSAAGVKTIVNGKEVLNLASTNFLGFIGNLQIAVSAPCQRP